MTTNPSPVVILGAGINGAALARELVLNAVPVVLVDRGDISCGTTAYSSRLIHGGLRYLEYGDFALVRESLRERRRLLDLAPHLVQPLELQIPIDRRGGGWSASIQRFVRGRSSAPPSARGLWLIRSGLWMYDRLARDRQLPAHRVLPGRAASAIAVDNRRYRWLCSYWDAQLQYPELFVVALLQDARQAAASLGVPLAVYPYHEVARRGSVLEIRLAGGPAGDTVRTIEPAAVVNATGAWVDHTLQRLEISAPRKIGGTKGSHCVTFHPQLSELLAGRGLYVEADDGRPVFVLPLGRGVLVGTTDLKFQGDPGAAVASEEELEYLLSVVRTLFPDLRVDRADIHLHYAGVRPLPYTDASSPAAISRRHWMEPQAGAPWPLFSIIGGKLTTCRSLAEEAADRLLATLGRVRTASSRDRPLPGGEKSTDVQGGPRVIGTDLAVATARRAIESQWVTRLNDLVERRLMLLYDPRLSTAALRELAGLLVEAGKLGADSIEAEVQRTVERLRTHFGKHVPSEPAR